MGRTLLLLLGISALGCSSKSSSGARPSDSGASNSSPDAPLAFPPAGNLDCSADATDWPMWGQNVCNTNSQANAGGISPATVGTLGVKWTYQAAGDVSATPTVVQGSVYVPDWAGNINRLDGATGQVTWSLKIGDLLKAAGDAGSALPGFVSRNSPIVTGGSVIFGTIRSTEQITSPGPSAYLLAIDQNSGQTKWATLLDAHLAAVVTGSPVVDGNRVYVGVSSQEEFSALAASLGQKYTCCSFRGSVVAIDVASGAVIWRAYTISDAAYFSDDAGTRSGLAGNAIWSSTPVVDRKRKQLYVTTGNNYGYGKDHSAGAAEGNYVDAVMALDTETGAVKWARSFPKGGADLWTLQDTSGPDSDFGAGANLFTATVDGAPKDLVGAGQKSGMYWALDADTGATVWSQNVGPGGHLGGIHWGTATDGKRVYMEVNYEPNVNMPFGLGGAGKQAGQTVATGIWSAIDANNGNILWQLANPALPSPLSGASCNGPVAVVNGVLFAGSMDAQGTMFALDASSGDVLWSFPSGGTVYGGPAIAGGVVYWGSGYPSSVRPLGFGTSSKKLYAFGLGLGSNDAGADAAPSDSGTD